MPVVTITMIVYWITQSNHFLKYDYLEHKIYVDYLYNKERYIQNY